MLVAAEALKLLLTGQFFLERRPLRPRVLRGPEGCVMTKPPKARRWFRLS